MHIFFARNWQLPFLNQRNGENNCRKYFMINHYERMLLDPMGIEPTTLSPVRHASNWATEASKMWYGAQCSLLGCLLTEISCPGLDWVEVLRPSQPLGSCWVPDMTWFPGSLMILSPYWHWANLFCFLSAECNSMTWLGINQQPPCHKAEALLSHCAITIYIRLWHLYLLKIYFIDWKLCFKDSWC